MEDKTYGSRAWIESQYASSQGDPWGLDWRPSQRYRYVRMFQALERTLADTPRPLSIVDVGCATGAFTAMLSGLNGPEDSGYVTGVDISASAVERAAARFPHINFECLSLEECAVAHTGRADLVTCMEVLYYLPSQARAAAAGQLRRMLKPGGWLLASSMIASPPYFSLEELKALLAEEFQLVEEGVLHLKPLSIKEKLLMKLRGQEAGNGAVFHFDRVQRWERLAGRLLPGLARSHGYVIARCL